MINDEEQTPVAKENISYDIAENSDEWKRVEFHLKSSIPSEIKITKIISVKNTTSYNQFEFLSSNHLWSYGWYNLKGEDYETKMKEMREKTFPIPKIGVNFRVGAIFDSSNSSEVESAYVLCKIIIGKSFCRLKQEGEKEYPPVTLDPPYESYMYCSPEQSAKSQKMSWSMTKPYSYYIKNRNFIEPLYAVFFTHIDSFITNMQSKYMCFECKVKEADVYCPACVNYYCNECQNVIHFGNATDNRIKNIFMHGEPVKITNTTRPGRCSVHPDRESEYYCEECKRAICGYCRFKGSHAKGMQNQHQLEDIYVTFQKTNNQNQNQDYEDKKKNGISTVRKITEQIKAIDLKMQIHQNEIDKDFDDHKKQMQTLSKNAKIEVFEYISALREIKRNIMYYNEYFNEREKYLMEQKNYPELAFIWSIHEEVINEFLNNMEELKKMDFSKLKEKLKVNLPVVVISNENFGFNKTKVQTEIANKRNIQKNDIFEQKQKEENYSIIDKTRALIAEIRKKRKEELEQQELEKEELKEKDSFASNSNPNGNEKETLGIKNDLFRGLSHDDDVHSQSNYSINTNHRKNTYTNDDDGASENTNLTTNIITQNK